MDNGEIGENSRRGRGMDEDGRGPYKKARYVWQLKGKYHLKRHYYMGVNSETQPSREVANSDSESEGEFSYMDRVMKRCLDSLAYTSNNVLDRVEDLPDLAQSMKSIKSLGDKIPVSLVEDYNRRYDEYLEKLQARQVAKSFLDNTINTILESKRWTPFDATDLVENCENGEQVEDEGIMMAIQSHGLQSNTLSGQAECFEEPAVDVIEEQLEDTDFLTAAVSVAIQKKGLSSYNNG